jgi:protein-L-isoaspartate(D-aspartate) O-methyltransferase
VSRTDRLVDGLVRDGAIRDERIERAFRAVPRHWFLPETDLDDVYRDRAVVTHRGPDDVPISSSSQPALMARMLTQLAVEPGMTVLEIGTGTGYNAALLGQLVGPAGRVVTIDVDPAVTGPAERHLAAAGASNVTVVTGDGWSPPAGGTFDRIEATVGVWDIAPAWLDQLRRGGVLVVPLWLRAGQQVSVAFGPTGGRLVSSSVEPCGFMRMRGPGAGEPAYHRVGRWTVGLDRRDPRSVEVLEDLLASEPRVVEAPPLEPGWFTAIALAEPGAVHLFTEGPEGSTVATGILHVSPPGLGVVVEEKVRAFGSDDARVRLLDLLGTTPAVDPARLTITAVPTGQNHEVGGALAALARPHFTFVVRSGLRRPPATSRPTAGRREWWCSY